jgi:hypothetical protein
LWSDLPNLLRKMHRAGGGKIISTVQVAMLHLSNQRMQQNRLNHYGCTYRASLSADTQAVIQVLKTRVHYIGRG